MASTGSVPLASMGIDAPLACLSRKPRSFFDYFFQLFAQVTNPPIGRFARAHGHLDGALPGQPRQPPRGLAERLPAHPARCPGAHRRGARRHRAYRPHRLRHAALPRGLSARRRRGRAQAGARGPLPKGRRGRARGCEHRRALQPRRGGRGAHPIASGHERRAPPPHRPRPAHLCRPRGRKRRRRVRARRGGARGLLGERRRPLHGARADPRARRPRGAARPRRGRAHGRGGHRQLRPRARGGHGVDHVEDGHLHRAGLPLRADLRGGWPLRGGHRPLLPRHGPRA